MRSDTAIINPVDQLLDQLVVSSQVALTGLDDSGYGPGLTPIITPEQITAIKAKLTTFKDTTLVNFNVHTDRLSGVTLQTGNKPDLNMLAGIGLSYMRILQSMDDPIIGKFEAIFGGVLIDTTTLVALNSALSTLHLNLDLVSDIATHFSAVDDQLIVADKLLTDQIRADELAYSNAFDEVSRYAKAIGIYSVAKSDDYGRHLFDKYIATNSLKALLTLADSEDATNS